MTDPPFRHSVEWRPSGRGKAQCEPDPRFPKGVVLNACKDTEVVNCEVTLPYPAPECGFWIIRCQRCSVSVAVTAAGRPDDPVMVKVP